MGRRQRDRKRAARAAARKRPPPGDRQRAWVLSCFAVFWLGITSFMVVPIGGTIRNRFVEGPRYRPVAAVVTGAWTIADTRRAPGPVIEFRYEVDGRTYHSRREDFRVTNERRRWPEVDRILAEYPPGRTFTAYYDPAAPERAVREWGLSPTQYFGMLFAAVFVAVGLLFLSLAITEWRRVLADRRRARRVGARA